MPDITRLGRRLANASPRFRKVALHIANGKSAAEIADIMQVKHATAVGYIGELMRALRLEKINDLHEQRRAVSEIMKAMPDVPHRR